MFWLCSTLSSLSYRYYLSLSSDLLGIDLIKLILCRGYSKNSKSTLHVAPRHKIKWPQQLHDSYFTSIKKLNSVGKIFQYELTLKKWHFNPNIARKKKKKEFLVPTSSRTTFSHSILVTLYVFFFLIREAIYILSQILCVTNF